MCGTDGVTYDNVCQMKLWAVNARVDYRGPCVEVREEDIIEDICDKVTNEKKCRELRDCNNVIQPADGCCPKCGM